MAEKISRIIVEDPHGNTVDREISTSEREIVMAEHNFDPTAHEPIRTELGQAIAQAAQNASTALSQHNQSDTAHADIRRSIADVSQAAADALKNHDADKDAHPHIQGLVNAIEGNVKGYADGKVSEHNLSEYAHPDIRSELSDKLDDILVEGESVVVEENGRKVVKFHKDQFGKVDGVKVNGMPAPFDEENNALVEVPTRIDQLEDKATYATKAEAQAMVDSAKILTATANSNNLVGTPKVTPSISGNNIHFEFENFKGEKGADGNTVILNPNDDDPEHPSKYTLYSEKGENNDGSMTQKAITEELVKVAYTEEAASTEGKIDFTNQYITTNNEWSTSQSGKNNGRMIPITPGKIYKVVATVGTNRLAILKSSNSTTVDFCDGYPSVIPMAAQGDQYLFVAPSDANYLYYATYMTSSARTVSIYEEKPIIEKVAGIEDEIEDIKSENESIKETLIIKDKQTLSSSNNGFVGSEDTWTGVTNGNWKHAVTDIKPGRHYRIESERATSINVLRSYTKPTTDGGIPDFSEEEGFTGRIMVDVSPYKYDFVAPSDAAKLVVCTQRRDNNANYPTNTKVYETIPVNQAIEEGIGGSAKQVKMLVIGDSWGRDIATELQPAAADMGLNLYVAQAYQGGSGLYNQYKGMDDATRHYLHGTGSSAYEQYVQGTYQLWTYASDTPTKTPSTGYNNGKCGVNDGTAWGKVSAGGAWAAKTLDEILASQDWDIILVRLHCGELQVEDSLMADEEDEDKRFFDINDFIGRMEDSLTAACKAKVKWGLATTWSYPVEAYNIDRDKIKSMLKAMDLYDSWNGMSAADKQAVFNGIYDTMQTNFQKVCKHLGDKLSYAVNIAKAIQEARNSAWLGDIGYHLNRSSSDMHLSNGIPKYICALAILYSIFDKGRNALKLDYIPDLVDGSGTDSDGGSDDSAVTPTKALCVGAQAVAWEAVCNMI